ncbi:MAG TPA: hypothetical protein VK995_06910 [Oceanipulchritudo sp.]|nr:hypothetical protein [Oceanipulchritudo sp.]
MNPHSRPRFSFSRLMACLALVGGLCLTHSLAANETVSNPVIQAAGGDDLSLFLKSDGTVWATGENFWGQLGDGTYDSRTTPVPVLGLTDVVAVAAGSEYGLFLKSDGTVWGTGSVNPDQVSTPEQIPDLTGVIAMAGGYGHSLFLKGDGTIMAMGWNSYGQLGDGTNNWRATPALVPGLTDIVAVAVGDGNSLFVKGDGTVYAAGDNYFGQLGIGTIGGEQWSPVQVPGLTGVVAVSSGSYHSIYLKSDGTVWAAGVNFDGQLGIGTNGAPQSTPVQVSGLTDIVAVSTGAHQNLFLKSDGTVWVTGMNYYGELGIGSTEESISSPTQVVGLTNVTAVATGDMHSLFVQSDGTAWATGNNTYGQLGIGTIGGKEISPTQVLGLVDFVEGYVDDPILSWIYRYTPDWAYSGTMGFVYLPQFPWIYNSDFGFLYFFGDNIRSGEWIYMASTGKWAWLVESNGGFFIYTDGTYNNFLNPILD